MLILGGGGEETSVGEFPRPLRGLVDAFGAWGGANCGPGTLHSHKKWSRLNLFLDDYVCFEPDSDPEFDSNSDSDGRCEARHWAAGRRAQLALQTWASWWSFFGHEKRSYLNQFIGGLRLYAFYGSVSVSLFFFFFF